MSTNVVPVKKEGVQGGNGSLATRINQSPFMQMRREFDRVFDRFFSGLPSLWNGFDQDLTWGVDLQDKEDSVLVRFEVPGFDAKEIDLKLSGNDLVLRAEHKTESKSKDRQEESESSLYRSITLPTGVMTEKAEAKYANGLLSVSIPKSEANKSRKIAIHTN